MTIKQAATRFALVWFLVTLATYFARMLKQDDLLQQLSIGFVGAIAIWFFGAYVWGKGLEQGESEVRATEVPVARERGRDLGRSELMDTVSADNQFRALDALFDNVQVVVDHIRDAPNNRDFLLVLLRGEVNGPGTKGEVLFFIPRSVAEAARLEEGRRYRYCKHADPQFEVCG